MAAQRSGLPAIGIPRSWSGTVFLRPLARAAQGIQRCTSDPSGTFSARDSRQRLALTVPARQKACTWQNRHNDLNCGGTLRGSGDRQPPCASSNYRPRRLPHGRVALSAGGTGDGRPWSFSDLHSAESGRDGRPGWWWPGLGGWRYWRTTSARRTFATSSTPCPADRT